MNAFVVPKYNIRFLKAGYVYEVIRKVDLGFNNDLMIIVNDIGVEDMIPVLDPRFDIYYQVANKS